MKPSAALDLERVRANLRVFTARAPVAAVVKADGYRWGAAALVPALDALVESFVVADFDEFEQIRDLTARPIRLLSDPRPEDLPRLVARGGIPNVSTTEILQAVPRGAHVRVGTLDVAGWSALAREAWEQAAKICAERDLQVELWSHILDPADCAPIVAELRAARTVFEGAGAAVVSLDVAATSAALAGLPFDRVRVGIGLFGGGVARQDLRCALEIIAPVVARYAPGARAVAGYAQNPIPASSHVTVVRCGYGDGLPRALAGCAGIVSMGMQYAVLATDARIDDETVELIGAASDLDALAAHAHQSPHELVTSLGRMKADVT